MLLLVSVPQAAMGILFAAEATPELARLAALVHQELQDQRVAAGSPRLEREPALDRAALEIARVVALRDPKQRLRGRLRALERAESAGAGDLGSLDARVFLMRGSTTPVDEVLRQWKIANESWSSFIEHEALRYGLGATRSREGWLVVVALVGTTPAQRPLAGAAPPSTSDLRALEARVRSLVLEERRRRGLRPLVRDGELDGLARLHSLDMLGQGRLTHRGSDGSHVAERVSRRGISYRRVSENVALIRSEDAATKAFRGWMESAGHRANILDAAMTRTGVGVAWNADGTFYFTQVFMRPPRGR